MTQKELKNKSASIRARLHNIARKENIDLNVLIVLYMQERILYRLSKSEYRNNFVLKGGLLLFAHNRFKGRPTQDMDFLGNQISNDINSIQSIFREIFSKDCNDGLVFYTDTITIEKINEDAKYNGVRIKIRCLLGSAANVMNIDIGFGDIIVPKPVKMQFPCILDSEPAPEINAYTLESIIAEKFHAMIKLGIMNSRMKDFYDVYVLSRTNNFEGAMLTEALRETFNRRNTAFEKNPIVFNDTFRKDRDKKLQWNAFVRKTKLEGIPSNFGEVLLEIKNFLYPIYGGLLKEDDFVKSWNCKMNSWL